MRGGVKALIPRHLVPSAVVTAGSTIAVIVLALLVGRVPPDAPVDPATIPVTYLNDSERPYEAGDTTVTVTLWGDSVPAYLTEFFVQDRYPDLRINNVSVPGCDLLDLTPAWDRVLGGAPSPDCRASRDNLARSVADSHSSSVVVMAGTLLSFPHYAPDGSVLWLEDAAYEQTIDAKLDALLASARAGGADGLQIVTIPCREDAQQANNEDLRSYMQAHPEVGEAVSDPVIINGWLSSWAQANGQPVLDLYGELGCEAGFHAEVNGVTLYEDQIHFTPQAAVMLWTWLAPSMRDNAIVEERR